MLTFPLMRLASNEYMLYLDDTQVKVSSEMLWEVASKLFKRIGNYAFGRGVTMVKRLASGIQDSIFYKRKIGNPANLPL